MADAVKSIAADSLVQPLGRPAVNVYLGRKRRMEGGVKNGNLRYVVPKDPSHNLHHIQFNGIMRRREDCQPVDGLGHLRSNSHALHQLVATVHDPMAHTIDLGSISENTGLAAP